MKQLFIITFFGLLISCSTNQSNKDKVETKVTVQSDTPIAKSVKGTVDYLLIGDSMLNENFVSLDKDVQFFPGEDFIVTDRLDTINDKSTYCAFFEYKKPDSTISFIMRKVDVKIKIEVDEVVGVEYPVY